MILCARKQVLLHRRSPSLTRHINNGIRSFCRFPIIKVHPIKISALIGLVKVLLGLHMLHNPVLTYDPGTKAARKAGHRRQRRTAQLICTISDEDYDYEMKKALPLSIFLLFDLPGWHLTPAVYVMM